MRYVAFPYLCLFVLAFVFSQPPDIDFIKVPENSRNDSPAITFTEDGTLWLAWCSYQNGQFRLAGVDENVGRVLHALQQMGDEDDTGVVYSSDNGFFIGEHHFFDKRFMYEESILKRMSMLQDTAMEREPIMIT